MMPVGSTGMDAAKKPVTVIINGRRCRADAGERILSVAIREKIAIPHLCYEASLDPYGACRLCLVEVIKRGKNEMTTSCTLWATEGLDVVTDTPDIVKHRNILFELYLAQAPKSEIIKKMAAQYGVTKTRFFKKVNPADPLGNACILCGLCVRVCDEIMGAGAITFVNRGPYTVVNTPFSEVTRDCLGCGACAKVCPTGAIRIDDLEGERVMTSWSGTRVPLVQCRACGRFFAPQALAAKTLARLTPALAGDVAALCPECRGQQIAEREIRAKTGGAGNHA
ncbi:MAG: 2Fe-2S iron-sulfur cluster-binding protein [Methanoregula sp.]|nr:2Fe-2S iron-sulfur cluster-binding protein [Methanoregula sp.]MDD5024659.1 2Fe-2S iron-sulfur cluster-binding protein [Methanoregula sp.]MDD5187489.1 2Fe-2S iron-sulfur cluster-binding protein [Methanoregula sp.]